MTARYRQALDVAANWLAGSVTAVAAAGFALTAVGLAQLLT